MKKQDGAEVLNYGKTTEPLEKIQDALDEFESKVLMKYPAEMKESGEMPDTD
jgi:hypothetical protein